MDILTDTQLAARGWSIIALRQEIAAGRLRAKTVGTGFAVAAADFDAWMDSPTGQRMSRGDSTPSSARQVHAGQVHAHHTAPSSADTGEQWAALAEKLIASGTPASVARQYADAKHPGGREQLVRTAQAADKAKRARERTRSLARYTR